LRIKQHKIYDEKLKTQREEDQEWIYMLEDKLVCIDEYDEKIIKHSDFKQVIKDWKTNLK